MTPNERKVILKEDWAESQFYVLPKIHKSKQILEYIEREGAEYVSMSFPEDLKGRPINGDVQSVTHGLSKLLDKILNPLVVHLKTFIKDEYDFLRKFPKQIPANSRIVCCDVTSLYTSIPTDLGIKALDYWLTKLSSLVHDRFTKPFILEAVKFVLEKNFFQFNSTMWHQLSGTAMGKSFAPPYACLTLGYLEETILFPRLIPNFFEPTTAKLIIDFFMRFIDDGINVLPESIPSDFFVHILNKMDASIQYTVSSTMHQEVDSIRHKCTNFLSIKTLVAPNGKVKFDVHYKETNAHDYLAFDSHHPEHTRRNIPYVLAKRINVITSEGAWVQRNLQELKQFLLDRKYPLHVIEEGFHNAKLQGPANRSSQTKVVPMITPYLGNLDSSNIVNAARDLIASSSNARVYNAFKDVKFVQCHSQTPNLLQILSSSQFLSSTPIRSKEPGTFHCTNQTCEICRLQYLQKCKSFVTSNGTEWKIKSHVTCQSKNVVYFLKCKSCMIETKLGKTDNLRKRTNNHRSCCRNGGSSDIFDNHVYRCSRSQGKEAIEPFFLLFVLMECSDYNKLINIERNLHLAGHDTTFKRT